MKLHGEPTALVETKQGANLVGFARFNLELTDKERRAAKADGTYWAVLCEVQIGPVKHKIKLSRLAGMFGYFFWDWTLLSLSTARATIWAAAVDAQDRWRVAAHSPRKAVLSARRSV